MTDQVSPNNLFVIGLVISVIYFIVKFLEMRFIESESQKPMKVLLRDTIVVCISSVIGVYVLDQFKNLSKKDTSLGGGAPSVFVDTPGF
jgi:uncharacterized membrane protein